MPLPFLLSRAQMRRIAPHFPLSHGVPRVDDRRVISGIIYVIRRGLQWRDALAALASAPGDGAGADCRVGAAGTSAVGRATESGAAEAGAVASEAATTASFVVKS